MRRDVLEHLAEEIGARQADPLASFTTWDEGRRKLDGMSRGKRWDIDREQSAWERENAAELKRYEARHNWAKFEKAHPERVTAAQRRWVKENREHLAAYNRRRYARMAAEKKRAVTRKKHLAMKADPRRWALFLARQERFKSKKNAKAKARYWALDEAGRRALNREQHRRFYKYKPEGKRKCSRCGQPGHNVKRCGRLSPSPGPRAPG